MQKFQRNLKKKIEFLEQISKFSKVAWYKLNYKSQLYFYIWGINGWMPKLKMQYHVQSTKGEDFGVSVTNHLQCLHAEN